MAEEVDGEDENEQQGLGRNQPEGASYHTATEIGSSQTTQTQVQLFHQLSSPSAFSINNSFDFNCSIFVCV